MHTASKPHGTVRLPSTPQALARLLHRQQAAAFSSWRAWAAWHAALRLTGQVAVARLCNKHLAGAFAAWRVGALH
jgi:hypothetical protein